MSLDLRKKIVKIFWGCILFPPVLLLLLIIGVWLFADIPSFEELENPDSKLATELIADDGSVLSTFHIENRAYVNYQELSPYLVKAVIATEDERFYSHSGIDFISLGRVLFKTLLLGDLRQGGGSTITQQLAKTLYPREDVSSSVIGVKQFKILLIKLKEWITAIKIERDYSKDEIVDMYFNAVFFGSGAYGIKTASQTFFMKDPIDLNMQESATLVGMINKPTRYNPYLNPDKSLERRNFVLSQMEKSSFITESQLDSVLKLPIELHYNVLNHNSGLAPYFRDMLRRYMKEKEPKAKNYQYREDYSVDSLLWATDALYGWLEKNRKADGSKYNLDKDGLKIYTTINARMQKYAEEAVQEHLSKDLQPSFTRELRYKKNPPFSNDIQKSTRDWVMKQAYRWSDRYRSMKSAGVSQKQIDASFKRARKMRVFAWNKDGYEDTRMSPEDSIKYYKSILRAGFIVMEPNTSNVKAYVGGPNYRYFKYDNISQSKRQVGSVIKPFLYTLAMQEGMRPDDKVVNVPQTIMVGNKTWTPRSSEKDEWIGKTVTVKWGLTNSSNNISAYLMKQFGPRPMVQLMKKMGIGTYIDEVPSICVGSPEIRLLDMVAAYNVFPSKGIYTRPMYVTKITDNQGNVISNFVPSKHEAISENVAYTVIGLMQSVIDHGTGIRLRYKYGIKGDIAGKTGTTNDNSDGWFIAYTPKLTAGVWVGAEDRQVHFQSVSLGQGANMALPIWAIFYKKLLSDKSLGFNSKDEFKVPLAYNLDPINSINQEEIQGDKQVEEDNTNFFE